MPQPRYKLIELRAAIPIPFEENSFGYAVLNLQNHQLESVHALTRTEAAEMLARVQETALVKENWPDPDDPEVQALVNDQAFEPIGKINVDVFEHPVYRLHMAAETIARRRAGLEQADERGTGVDE